MSCRLRILLIALAILSPSTPAQDLLGFRVGSRGDPTRLEIVGSETFDAAELHEAVTGLLRFPNASRPTAELTEYLAFLETAVRDGHWAAGFPDVAVEATPSPDGGVWVTIDEGKRVVAGDIVVSGNRAVPTEEIIAALTAPRDDPDEPPAWTPGKFPRLDAEALVAHQQRATDVYRARGYFGVTTHLSTRVLGDARIALVLEVLVEGEPCHIGRIEFTGEFTDDPAEILEHIGLAEGQVFTPQLYDQITHRLEGLGRYMQAVVEIDPADPASGLIDPLGIRLTQASFVPSFAETPWDELDVLRRGVAGVQNLLEGEGHLHARRVLSTPLGSGALQLGPSFVDIVVSGTGALLRTDAIRLRGQHFGELVLGYADNSLLVSAGDYFARVPVSIPAFRLVVNFHPQPTGQFYFGWGFGMKTDTEGGGPLGVDFNVHDTALMNLLLGEGAENQSDDGVVATTIRRGDYETRLSAPRDTGALSLRMIVDSDDARSLLEIVPTSVADATTEQVGQWQDAGYREVPVRGILLPGLERSVEALISAPSWEGEATRPLLLAFARRLEGLLADWDPQPAEPDDSTASDFRIPEQPLQDAADFSAMIESALDKVGLPPRSWPRVFAVELPLLALNPARLPFAQRQLVALMQAERIGPLGSLFGAWVVQEELDQPRLGTVLAAYGSRQLDFEMLWSDLEALGHPAEMLLTAMGEAWRELHAALTAGEDNDLQPEEAAAVLHILDAVTDRRDPIAYARTGLEAIWAADLRRLVKARLDRRR